MTELFIIIPILFAAGIAFAQFLLPIVYDYCITQKGVRVRFLMMRVFNIPFSNIKTMRHISMKDFYLMNLFQAWRFGNRLWGTGAVLIETKKGIDIIMTPDDPIGFIQDVNKRMSKLEIN